MDIAFEGPFVGKFCSSVKRDGYFISKTGVIALLCVTIGEGVEMRLIDRSMGRWAIKRSCFPFFFVGKENGIMGGNTVECFVKNIEGFLCVYKNSRWKRWGVLKQQNISVVECYVKWHSLRVNLKLDVNIEYNVSNGILSFYYERINEIVYRIDCVCFQNC